MNKAKEIIKNRATQTQTSSRSQTKSNYEATEKLPSIQELVKTEQGSLGIQPFKKSEEAQDQNEQQIDLKFNSKIVKKV